MKLNLPKNKQLFETQKSLMQVIATGGGFIVLITGTALQIINPETSFSFPLRLFFVSLFFLTAYVCGRKNISIKMAEQLLAFMGSLLITKLLAFFYLSNFQPIPLMSSLLVIVGMSGIFTYKSSLALLATPSLGFIFFSLISPAESPIMTPSMSFILLISANIVGYFLTWQKVYLINKVVEQESHKNTIIHHLHEGVILRDNSANILTINPATTVILGLTLEDVVGKKLQNSKVKIFKDDGITPCPIEELPSEMAASTGKIVRDYPLTVVRVDQSTIQVEITAIPIMSVSNPTHVDSVLSTFRDVTALKKAQNLIESQKIQVLAHSKLKALGEMASGIAHEINNPLTIILGRVQQTQKNIENGTATPPSLIESLKKITDTALRISKIVKSMKSLSRQTNPNEFEKANLRSIVDDIVNVTNDYITQNEIKVIVNVENSIELECNSGLISQLFINLMSNSIDAIKTQTSDRWIQLDSVVKNNIVITYFSDSGQGIPASLKEKIMLPFFTTKEAGKGTGIGLSLCRTIVENHGGKFYINETSPNTCFTFELPIEKVATAQSPSAA